MVDIDGEDSLEGSENDEEDCYRLKIVHLNVFDRSQGAFEASCKTLCTC